MTSPTPAQLREKYAHHVSDTAALLTSREAMTADWIDDSGDVYGYEVTPATDETEQTITNSNGDAVTISDVWLEESTRITEAFIDRYDTRVVFSIDGAYQGAILTETVVDGGPAETITVTVDTTTMMVTASHDGAVFASQRFTDDANIDDTALTVFNMAAGV